MKLGMTLGSLLHEHHATCCTATDEKREGGGEEAPLTFMTGSNFVNIESTVI